MIPLSARSHDHDRASSLSFCALVPLCAALFRERISLLQHNQSLFTRRSSRRERSKRKGLLPTVYITKVCSDVEGGRVGVELRKYEKRGVFIMFVCTSGVLRYCCCCHSLEHPPPFGHTHACGKLGSWELGTNGGRGMYTHSSFLSPSVVHVGSCVHLCTPFVLPRLH